MNTGLTIAQLKSFSPLNQLTTTQLEQLSQQFVIQPVLKGNCLFDLGAEDNHNYFLQSGSFALTDLHGNTNSISSECETSLSELAPGQPRTLKAVALTDALVLRIESQLLQSQLDWKQMMQDALLDLEDERFDISWLEKLLANPLFSRVPAQNIRQMLQRLTPLDLAAGSRIIEQGAIGDCSYFVNQGRVQVSREQDGEVQVLAILEEAASFGEDALLSDQPRNAHVDMLTDGQILQLARQDFISLLQQPVVDQYSFDEALQQVEQQQAQWLDVRRLDEYEQAHAYGAIHMPLDVLRLKSRMLDPEPEYICYCDNGKRSRNAVYLLSQLGFKSKMLSNGTSALSSEQIEGFLWEQGAGYLLRSGGRIEVSR